jgi:hypothetical protein
MVGMLIRVFHNWESRGKMDWRCDAEWGLLRGINQTKKTKKQKKKEIEKSVQFCFKKGANQYIEYYSRRYLNI